MNYFKLFFLMLIVFSCQNQKSYDFVANEFDKKKHSYKKIEYQVVRIDTFSKESTMNRGGLVLLEQNENDTLFGMSFYAVPNSTSKEYLHDKNRAFEISNENNSYKVVKSYYGFLGSPGGQLIPENLIRLDTVYKSVSLIETKNSYKLNYQYENDTIYNISNIRKEIFIDKQTFIPSKIVKTSEMSGEKRSQYFIIENVKVNEQVESSIEMYKNNLQDFVMEEVVEIKRNSKIGQQFFLENIQNINTNELVHIQQNMTTLISFWEIWCSPCIRSLPKINALHHKYKNSIKIIGISTENQNNVKRMLTAKNIEYLNLIGTEKLHRLYEINSFPTYFLLDKNGFIVKEYFLFSDEIERDIKALLLKS